MDITKADLGAVDACARDWQGSMPERDSGRAHQTGYQEWSRPGEDGDIHEALRAVYLIHGRPPEYQPELWG